MVRLEDTVLAEGLAFTFYEDYAGSDVDEYKNDTRIFEDISNLKTTVDFRMRPEFATLVIEGGKKDKLRAGDILGALTGDVGLDGKKIGKIDIYEREHSQLLFCYMYVKSSNTWTLFLLIEDML